MVYSGYTCTFVQPGRGIYSLGLFFFSVNIFWSFWVVSPHSNQGQMLSLYRLYGPLSHCDFWFLAMQIILTCLENCPLTVNVTLQSEQKKQNILFEVGVGVLFLSISCNIITHYSFCCLPFTHLQLHYNPHISAC